MQNVIHVEDGMIYGGFGGVNSTPSLPIKSIKRTVTNAISMYENAVSSSAVFTPIYTVEKDCYAVLNISVISGGQLNIGEIRLARSEATDSKTEYENDRTLALLSHLNMNNARSDVANSVFLPAGSKIFARAHIQSSGAISLSATLYEVEY